ncbi:P-loop containing nucleoside triphosphate hydrolase protein [Neohortaea acidophila]|uniref:RNA helicase n=1 Tax=Neohortaea acidophila TaxID=245834 RepID=A0A6A6Q016_9PEZI|nr:P-loop containing nucleoside triphosphate hydrolase protein [Neohortaea acidophila]KAF2485625.1 P-loop containing nucleoside triphosphate hydrolase protein [Neohortaea acidophila]
MAPLLDDDGFVGTLSDNDAVSDDEILTQSAPAPINGTKRKRETQTQKAVKKARVEVANGEAAEEDSDVDSDFEFGLEDDTAVIDDYAAFVGDDRPSGKKTFDVEAAAARRRPQVEVESDEEDEEVDRESEGSFDGFGGGANLAEEDDNEAGSGSEQDGSEEDEDGEADEEDDALPPALHPADLDAQSESEADEDADEAEKRNAFFAPEVKQPASTKSQQSFHTMSLSRPILKGLAEIGFSAPTPIQAKTIPVALAGKDVVGGAVTGSGKTGAFIIPILERLLFRPKRTATTRVAILTPTRELALQCFNVAKKLAAFTDITFGQAIGGLNLKEQEKQLKQRPDIVIATPGRFIDLERNSSAFAVNTVEILVLDEADRMLEEGFADELNEILTKIPKSRQTMLFSATMTSKVDDLIRVGLQRPVRLLVDAQNQTVAGLTQEFVRLRPGREAKRLAYLMYLCSKVHTDRVIVFFRQKKDAHRTRILFALCGLKAAELHGSMSQEQRIQAIEAYRSGKASFLLATDLASRGLDIKGIETVINFEAPQSLEIYLHRVGRTARAGRSGRACTLAAEPDRKVVKAAVKSAKAQGAQIRQRTIEAHDADAWFEKVEGLQVEVEAILKEEKEERVLQSTERDLTRADNIVKYKEEILARPRKTWFESEKEKAAAKGKGAEALNGPLEEGAAGRKKTKGKLSNKQKKRLMDKDERREEGLWKKGKGAGAAKGKPQGKGKAKGQAKGRSSKR